jgi:C_GCAxxG_C_C family probable redox protein
MTNEEKAVDLFKKGYSCAQAVYLACRDENVMNEDAAVLASAAFGGGVGGLAQTCGVLCAGMMVLSERFSPRNPADTAQKQRSRAMMGSLGALFESKFGTCQCNVLKPRSEAKGGVKTCSEYVRACAGWLSQSKAPFSVSAIAYRTPAYEQELAVRQAELREPLGMDLYKEDLSHEVDGYHIGAYLGGELVGTLYLLPVSDDSMQIRQVAVKRQYQGLGAGQRMMGFAESFAKERGIRRLFLHPEKPRKGFTITSGT